VEWIHLAQNRDQWQVLVNTLMIPLLHGVSELISKLS